MADCEALSKCLFFHDMLPDMPAVTEGLKMLYCLGDNSECARYMVMVELGSENVPRNLFPNELEKARFTIEKARQAGLQTSS